MQSTITVRFANHCREKVNCAPCERLLRFRGRYQRNNSWTDGQRMAMLDTIMKGFHCAPIYIIQHPRDKIDDVFDGAHRLETACDFVTNQFPIQKVKGKGAETITWESSPLAKYEGKFYRDMSDDDQMIFSNYSFVINTIKRDIAETPEELATLWVRLNNSGNELNDYEKYIPVYYTLYEYLKSKCVQWYGTKVVYTKHESNRGELEIVLMRMLAMSEPEVPRKFNSQVDIYKKWRENTFGNTSDVEANVEKQKSIMTSRLSHIHSVYTCFAKNNMFDELPNELITIMLISRVAHWCNTRSKLSHCESRIIAYSTVILGTTMPDMLKLLNCTQNNARYQQLLLDKINHDVREIVTTSDDPRVFTAIQKTKKLEEQQGKCTWCSKVITDSQKMDGHHILPYSKGGPTTLDNLQVLHEECHRQLHSSDK